MNDVRTMSPDVLRTYHLPSRYSIGNSDLLNGITYGWLYTLSRINKQPYTYTTAVRPVVAAATSDSADFANSSAARAFETQFELQVGHTTYIPALEMEGSLHVWL